MKQRLRNFMFRFFLAPSTGEPLAALRISIALLLLYESWKLAPHLDLLFGDRGILQAHLMTVITGPVIPYWLSNAGYSASDFLKGLECVHVLAALWFLVGFQTRAATIILFLTEMTFVNSGYLSSYGVHRYLHIFLFLLVFFPANGAWSIDLWRRGRSRPVTALNTFGLRYLQLFFLATYVNAGVSKMFGEDWWTGSAIWEVLNSPEFAYFDFTWLAQVPWLTVVFAWGTLVIETFYIFAVWIPRLRLPWVLGIMGLHLGIALFVGLQLFGYGMMLFNLALFLVPVSQRVFQRENRPPAPV